MERTLAMAAYRLLLPCEPQYLVESSLHIRCAVELFRVRRRLRMHTALHAGTGEKGARSKRELVFTPFPYPPPFAAIVTCTPEESSLASAGCASTFAVVVPRRYASLLSVYARSPFLSRLRGRLNVCISVVPFYS